MRANPKIPRLLAFNETGFNGTAADNYRTQGWNFLLSGGGMYGNLDFSFTAGHEDGTATPRFTGNYNAGGSPAIRAQPSCCVSCNRCRSKGCARKTT